ncbi:MAG: hypothetical protein JWR80_7493 [Bradyrhizobium sp.]|nr:hypothetical protein [Bradyrhizobium sp.]
MKETSNMTEENKIQGIKNIKILATTRYPIVSAYEFETLKEEAVIRKRMNDCTIYMVLQRPLTYFTDLTLDDGGIRFSIADDRQPPLPCYLPFLANKIAAPNTISDVHLLFLKSVRDEEPPFNDVGGFKVYREDGEFVVWYSAQKFLYEVVAGSLKAEIEGDPYVFLDFTVHYIGRAFDQKVWKRLTGHGKFQKVLTVEGQLSMKPEIRPAWEISLAMLSIEGFDEYNAMLGWELLVPDGMTPILHDLDTEEDFARFLTPSLASGAPELTNEIEAMLIAIFRPAYNGTRYKNYPEISNGTRSKGYTASELVVDKFPLILRTEHGEIRPVG